MMGDQDLDYPQRPTVSLNDLVPADSFYRQLADRLDFSFVRELVRDRYALRGHPLIDPLVFFKLQPGVLWAMFFEEIR